MTSAPSLKYLAARSQVVSGDTDAGPAVNTVIRQEPGLAARNSAQLRAASSRCGDTTL
jgi:hypothetical protein